VNTHLTINRLRKSLAEKNWELTSANDLLEERVRARTQELAELNHIYERFVPREFISLLNKESIREIRLGDQIKQMKNGNPTDFCPWASAWVFTWAT